MKKIRLIVLAVAMLCFFACGYSETEYCPFDNEAGIEETFTAMIDSEDESAVKTKTAIQSNGDVYWKEGDRISINGGVFTTFNVNGKNTDFKGRGAKKIDGYYMAYYPKELYNEGVPALPATQAYDPAGGNCPMYAKSPNTNLHFKNICGVVKINAHSDNKFIKSIKILADDSLCGNITIHDDYTAEVTGAGRDSVILNCPYIDITTAKDFYVAIPAGNYSSFKIVFTAADLSECTKTKSSGLSISRNQIVNITFSDALEFRHQSVSSYYNATTAIEDPVLEGGVNACDFEITSTQGGTQFKHQFPSDAAHPSINFAGGDFIEAKINWTKYQSENGSSLSTACSIFTIGGNSAWGGEGNRTILTVITWDATNHIYSCRFDVSGTHIHLATFQLAQVSSAEDDASGVIWLKVSKSGGIQYKFTESGSWTQAVASTNEYLAEVLTRDGSNNNPLYVGTFHQPLTVKYDYLKISRESDPVLITSLSLTPSSLCLTPGSTTTLVPAILPNNATTKALLWSSSDNSVATVDENGVVTAVAAGNATIMATAVDGSGIFTQCSVSIKNAIFFDAQGNQYDYQPDGWDLSGTNSNPGRYGPIQLPKINWTNGDYVEVQLFSGDSGLPFFIGNIESFWSPNNKEARSLYVVGQAWPHIKCKNVGEYTDVVDLYGTGEAFSNKKLTIRISSGLVEVQKEDGVFTQIPCTLDLQSKDTLWVGGSVVSDDCHINYIKIVASDGSTPITPDPQPTLVESITLSKHAVSIEQSKKDTVTVTSVLPANADNKAYSWSTSNSAVAAVDSLAVGCEITAVSAGTAKIFATALDGSGVKDSCVVTVTAPVPPAQSGETYYNMTGQTSTAQPAGFDVTDGFEKFALNNINWSNGDYLEVKLDPGTSGKNCLTIGNSASFPSPNLNGCYSLYVTSSTWTLVRICEGLYVTSPTVLLNQGVNGQPLTIRISENYFSYKIGDGDFTDVAYSHGIQDQSQLYLGSQSGTTGCHIYYIKVVSGENDTPQDEGTEYFFDKSGGYDNDTAQAFDADGGFKFKLPSIDWAGGDYFEADYTRTTGENGSSYFILGNNTAFTVGTNYNGAYCVAMNGKGWAELNKCDGEWVSGNTFLNTPSAWNTRYAIRISKDRVEYKEGSGEWQTANTTLALQSCNQDLYFGTSGSITGVHYNYIKWVKGSGSGSDTPVTPDEPEWTLKAINVTTPPTKTEYTEGDALDLTGMVVSATYEDNAHLAADKTEALTANDWTASPANGATLNTVGTQTVTITLKSDNTKTCTTSVSVAQAVAPPVDPPVVPEGSYYLKKDGTTSTDMPSAITLTANETLKLSLPGFSLSSADIEMKITSDKQDLYYLCIGADTNNNLPYSENYVYIESNSFGSHGWKKLIFGNKSRTNLVNIDSAAMTVKLTADGFYYKGDGASAFTKSTAATDAIISNFISLQEWYVSAFGNNHACTIDYILVTPVTQTSGTVQSSDTGEVTTSTIQGW